MNRVAAHIEKIQALIDAGGKDGKLSTPEAREEFERSMAITFEEHFAYQNAQAHAHAAGKLSPDEAMIVYRALGDVMSDSNGGWAKDTNLATKVTVTNLMAQLVGIGA